MNTNWPSLRRRSNIREGPGTHTSSWFRSIADNPVTKRRMFFLNLNEREFIHLDLSPWRWRMPLRVWFLVVEHLIRKWNSRWGVRFRSLFVRWTKRTVFRLLWGVDSFPRCDRTNPNCGRTGAVCWTSTATDRPSSHRRQTFWMTQRIFLIKSNYFYQDLWDTPFCNFEPLLPKLSTKNPRRRSCSSCVSIATSFMLFRVQ